MFQFRDEVGRWLDELDKKVEEKKDCMAPLMWISKRPIRIYSSELIFPE